VGRHEALGVVLELEGIGGAKLGVQLAPGALVGQQLDVLLRRDALVPPALGADAERLLELFAQVEVTATVALLPRVSRDLQAFAIRGARLSFLLEPGHHCHGRRGARVMG